jgi:FkbM family methyltransferase
MPQRKIPRVGDYLDVLAALTDHHSPNDPLYPVLKAVARDDFRMVFGESGTCEAVFPGIGHITLPYRRMGAVDSVNLFDLDELILFAFYRKIGDRYRRVLDIGANIGLHSIMMAKLGWQVTCFEPDPIHCNQIVANLAANDLGNVDLVQAAVSDNTDEREFVRVLGNTTGSHLAGAKSNPYGELDRFPVKVVDFRSLITDVDFIKLDAEGEESRILNVTECTDWEGLDAIIEVGSEANAERIFAHFQRINVNLFSQKTNWTKVANLPDMPISYKEGSLFISSKSEMPWH